MVLFRSGYGTNPVTLNLPEWISAFAGLTSAGAALASLVIVIGLRSLNTTYLRESAEAAKRRNRLDVTEDADRIRKHLGELSRAFALLNSHFASLMDTGKAPDRISYFDLQESMILLARSIRAHFPQLTQQADALKRQGQDLITELITYRLCLASGTFFDTVKLSGALIIIQGTLHAMQNSVDNHEASLLSR